jgi:hypothetical protein
MDRIGIHSTAEVLDEMEEGHLQPLLFWITRDLGKTRIGSSGIIRTSFQVGHA